MKLNKGIILIDIIVALALSLLFIVAISESSASARAIFNRAKAKNALLDAFMRNRDQLDLLPYQSKEITDGSIVISANARWYGNDRIQTNISISDGYDATIAFSAVRLASTSESNMGDGTSVCSVDFTDQSIVGSYVLLDDSSAQSHQGASISLGLTPINLPINPLLPLTDVEVRNNIAYISSDSSNSADPDLFVIDISNSANPKLLSSINTGPGIVAIALHGKRIYAAAASTAAQLHIIRLDGLDSPVLEKKYRMPLPFATATPPYATSIFYNNDHVYLGTEKWDGDEFSVIDVSNPLSPIKNSGLETGSKINDIYLHYNIAYVAASDEKQLRIINVPDPSRIALINYFSPSGWQRQEGKSLSYFEDSLGFGRTSGGFDISADHELFAWASTSMANLAPFNSNNEKGGIYGIVEDKSHLFVITHEPDHEFKAFDLRNTDGVFASLTSFSLPILPQTLTCDGNKMYVLSHSSPTLYEIDFK